MALKLAGVATLAVSLLLLQLCAAKTTGQASHYQASAISSTACYGPDKNQFPGNRFIAAGGDQVPNIWAGGANCGKWFRIQCTGNGCTNSKTISVRYWIAVFSVLAGRSICPTKLSVP
ncbi:hypothetical protein R1sor_000693 [Riccia sorocarpa]|uniref:Expansin-like EG45 domain-containing protein n=1 Tax=Riccia sorocarpa TaxID=122646 RepID=A0ABD3GVJ4_9MARC